MDKVVVAKKFEQFAEFWRPRIVGELNGQQVKLVKMKGDFEWHHHDVEDELFFVMKGQMIMKLRDRDVVVNPGEFLIVPRGVEHKPCAPEETHVMLFEPASTVNTGNVRSERTVEVLERL
ncbi:MAG: cupin domain-containing protein [Steroidobacteraceae bacterium]|jgi:mannose-6-phosphate isomerase-like protein (cupin superfamily)|nr:cupin domain-containing protein [Steroidobacteraceae bacterium]